MEKIVRVHFPGLKKELLAEALTTFFNVRETPGLRKKPSTSELLDWIKLLLAEDIPPEALRGDDPKKTDTGPARRAAQERTGRAPVRAAGVPESPRGPLSGRSADAGALLHRSARRRRSGHAAGVPERCSKALEARRRRAVARRVLLPRAHGAGEGRAAFRSLRPGVRRALRRRGETVREARRPSCPPNGCRQLTERLFSEEEKAAASQALGGWDKLLETLRQRLREQQGRHEGGNKWIGTAGTSPFGNQGFNPEGVRIGQAGSRHGRAVKVWEARDYRNLDDGVELGTRNLKMALRRLRRFAREGAAEELDLDGTIDATARNAGIARHQAAARAAQRREAAAAARRGRLDGSARQGLRGAVLGGARRVQAPRVLLLPQFPVRAAVEGQPAALQRDHRHTGRCCALSIPTTAWCSSATRP